MKLTSLLTAAIIGLSLTAAPATSHAGWGFLEPANIFEKIRKQIAKAEIGASIGLIDGELINGFNTALKYRLESEPSYLDGFYTRVDKYSLNAEINPGDIVDDNDSPFGFTIEQGTEVIFARQFKTQKDSLKAIPYTLKNLPLNANKAIRNLQIGDFVALQAKVGVVFSVGASTEIGGGFNLGGSTHVFLSGDFMIHLFRMDNDKVRVKLITMRKKGTGVNADIEYGRKFKIVGLRVIDRRIEKLVDLTPASLGFGKSANDVFMLDYVFDLKNAQASQAFDDFMSKKVKFKDLKVIDPTASRTDLANDLMTDMSDIEGIFNEDVNLPGQQRRIDRVFKGSNTSLDSSRSFKLGLSVIKLKSGMVYSQNQLLNYDRNNNEQRYLFDTYTKDFESKILFGLFGDKTRDGSNVVFNSDASWAPGSFVTYTNYREVKMRSVSKRDFRNVQEQVRKAIPAGAYAQIDWKNWDFDSLVNGYFKQQLFINPEALANMPQMNSSGYYSAFVQYIERTGLPVKRNNPTSRMNDDYVWTADYSSDLDVIAKGLSAITNPLVTNDVMFTSFRTMQKSQLWRERGIGFIMSMVPKAKANTLFSYEMTFSAKGVEPINFKIGYCPNEELYKSLMYIQNVINNRSFDLRLLIDENGNFKN